MPETLGKDETPGHLGGYIEGGDPATQFPDLWRWTITDLPVESMLDIGCGEGISLDFYRRHGVEVLGLDGVPQQDIDIIEWDFTKGPYEPDDDFDLIWSCEFLEHVEEQYAHNMIPTFRQGKIVLITHAFPGQGGHHHVNCRDPEYWRGFFRAAGFQYDPELTQITKSLAGVNKNPYNHYTRAGMAFRRLD